MIRLKKDQMIIKKNYIIIYIIRLSLGFERVVAEEMSERRTRSDLQGRHHHRFGASMRRTAGLEPFRYDHRYRTALRREERECSAVLVPDGADSYLRRSVPRLAQTTKRRDDE